MHKNKTLLTKLEQQVLNTMPDKSVVQLRSIREIRAASKNSLPTILHRLTEKGFLVRLSRGRYYVTKNRAHSSLVIGSNLVENGYISLESALFVYGAMKTIPLETYVATCQQRSRVRLIGPDKYVLVPFGRLVLGYGPKGEYRISSKGKTLFDCIQKIRYVGDVGNLISLVNLMDYGDLSDFMYFAIRYGTTALKERAGYIIELSTKAKDKRTKELIKELRANISKWVVVRLKPDSPIQEKHYSRRWHVYDNIGLENAATRV